ncbi:MAG: hypothetical protein LKI83_04155, partial [Actinomyces sp.]|nr:hypothetical protein [Actinomyces sp.]
MSNEFWTDDFDGLDRAGAEPLDASLTEEQVDVEALNTADDPTAAAPAPAAEPEETASPEGDAGRTAEQAADEAAADGAQDAQAPEDGEPDPIEKLRQDLRLLPGDWYVIHTYSGHERKVKANLEQRIESQNAEDYIFRVEVPDEYV